MTPPDPPDNELPTPVPLIEEAPPPAEPEQSPRFAPESRVRAFLAVNFPVPVTRKIAEQMDELRPLAAQAGLKVAWVPPANLHLTLKFFGTVRGEAIEAVAGRLARELPSLRPFELEARGLGAFPDPASSDRPRVVWVGVAGPGEKALRALQENVERWMDELGFPREARPFHPHVTLGRVMSEGPLAKLLSERTDRVYGIGRVAEIVVYESSTLARGAEYRALARVPIGR